VVLSDQVFSHLNQLQALFGDSSQYLFWGFNYKTPNTSMLDSYFGFNSFEVYIPEAR
jgi:hypothetical protein